jgi:hypothetical protein
MIKPLSDNQIDDRLYAALEKLGDEPGETIRGNTAIEAARQALVGLRLGLVWAAEKAQDHVPGVKKDRTQ